MLMDFMENKNENGKIRYDMRKRKTEVMEFILTAPQTGYTDKMTQDATTDIFVNFSFF